MRNLLKAHNGTVVELENSITLSTSNPIQVFYENLLL